MPTGERRSMALSFACAPGANGTTCHAASAPRAPSTVGSNAGVPVASCNGSGRSWRPNAMNSGPWIGSGRVRTDDWARPGSGGKKVGKNPTDRGKKGSKESVLVDGDGGPLSVVLAAANVNDHLLLEETIEAIVIERPEPTPEAPQHLCLDADYDNPIGREAAAAGQYTPHIVPVRKEARTKARTKGHKPRRWVVERTLASRCKRRGVLV